MTSASRWNQLRPWLAIVAIVAALVAVYYLLPFRDSRWIIGVLGSVAVVVGLLPLAVHEIRRILGSPHPLAATARAFAVLFSVAVLGFASTYYALEEHAPNQMAGLETKTDALYFTVTMMTTVGFGDVHPAGQTARVIATVNMVFNLVLLAVALRAVQWAARQRAEAIGRPRFARPPESSPPG